MAKLIEVRVPTELWPRRPGWKGRVVKVAPEGTEVREGHVVAEVEIEKAVIAIESPAAGRVAKVYVSEGDSVGPGDKLLAIEVSG